MKRKTLQMKRALRSVLLVLLLSVVGMGKMDAQSFTVGGLNYSVNDDGISVSVTGPNFSGESFENEIPSDWATIDADGDGYGWELASWANHTGNYGMASASFIDEVGAVTPDNYLVSGSINFTTNTGIRFYACANDAYYAAEHFGVAVSTGSQIDVTNFTTIAEWTMTAKSNNMPKGDRGLRDQCSWYEYTVDLSSYAGQIGYVAIRHFNCTDQWYLNVDDVNIGDDYVAPAPSYLNIPENVSLEGVSYGVTTIENSAFKNCSFYTGELTIPNSVTTIGNYAFQNCSGFTGSLTIPNSLTSIGYEAFEGCSGFIGNLTIGNSVTTIGNRAFHGCSGFTEILYYAINCLDAGYYSPFLECSGTLIIGDNVERIPANMFRNCSGFTGGLTLPNSVTTIGDYAFNGCSGFTGNLTIPNSVTEIGGAAFSGCSGFTGSLTIPNSVTEISSSAFYGCSGFTGSLAIPNSVTTIDNSAFSGCSGFTGNLTIGNSVTTIGNGAFYNCSGFTGNLTIPNSVTTIGDRAFWGCSGFTGSLTIGNSVTTIGSNAFYGCSGFTGSLTIGNSVTSIGIGAFGGCSGFTGSLSIPNSVTEIGGGAFMGCSGFTGSLTIGNSVMEIGSQAFYNCSSFTGNLTIPNSVTTIDEWAFGNCGGLTGSLTIPNSVSSIGNYAFYGCSFNGLDVDMISIPVDLISTIGGSYSGFLTIGNSVTTIGNGAFYNCSGFTGSLTIGNSVTTIGNRAFWGCSGFTGSLTIPNSVIEIGNSAFYNCSGFNSVYYSGSIVQWCNILFDHPYSNPLSYAHNLYVNNELVTDLVIPETVTEIKAFAFCDATCLMSLTIPNSVTTIGQAAFSGCSGFTGDLVIPNSVTTIGDYAFQNCSGFTGSLTIPNSVTTISYQAFYGCSGFTGDLTIPNSVTTISGYAFYGCSGFTGGLTIPNSVTEIGNSAFYGCSGLTAVYYSGDVGQWCNISFDYGNPLNYAHNLYIDNELVTNLVIPETVTEIKNYAFQGATCLTSLTIPNSVTSIGDFAFSGCYSIIGLLTIPNSVISIGGRAFENCSGFTGSLTIPNSVTTIGDYTFYDCYGFMGNLTIGNSVTTIGNYAFSSSSGFCSVTSLAETPPSLGYNPFPSFNSDISVYIPCGYEDEYSSVSWGGFNDFIGLCGGAVTVIADPEECGTVVGGGQIEANQLCTVTATANEGYVFGNWTYNGTVVSVEAEYAFYVADDMTLVAHFVQDGNISFADINVKSICVSHWDTNGDGELSYAEAAAVTSLGQVFRENTEITSFEELQYFIGLTTIMGYAFYNCSNLSGSLYIPNSVTTIDDCAFSGCSGFTGSLIIPNSVTSIAHRAFYGCSGFTGDMVIPNSVTSIGNYAFYNCSGFTGSLTIGNSVTSIDSYAFYNCSGFTGDLVIPNSVTSIGVLAFSGCRGFTGSLTIPNSVTWIGNYAFSYCSGLTGSLTIPNSVTTIGVQVFSNCSGFTGSLTIPSSVTSIGNWAFRDCSGFTGSLIIPNSVTTIGYEAFSGCSGLTGSLTIPNSVTSIGVLAFSGCSGLKEAMLYNYNPPSLEYYAFSNTSFPIYVPYESLNDYKTATNWSYYEDRIFPMAYITISGYGVGEGNYRFIASPLVENTAPTAVDNMITETAYDLYRFDQSEEAEWQNYKYPENTPNFFLTNGQGYLYANAEDVNLIFKGEFNEDDTKEVGLAYDANAEFAGWNLVGNPFPVNAYANKSYYTMNEEGSAIEPNMVSSATAIPACTGVMVMAESEGETVIFSTEAPEAATNQGCLQIELSQAVELVETPIYRGDGPSTGSGTLHDKAIVSFNAGDRLEKFVFNKENAVISIPQGGKELAIACSDKQGEVPLNFKATKNGEYTITIHPEAAELDYLHLIDNLTGADVDLLVSPAYTFTAKTTDYASRFRLVFSGNEADGHSAGSGSFAFINNGNIVFTGMGGEAFNTSLQIVDVQGRVIVFRDAVPASLSTAGMVPGVYVLRLVNGDEVRTQKLVVR